MWPLAFIFKWLGSVFKAVIGSEIGRIVLAVAVAYGLGFWKGHTDAESGCRALIAQSAEVARSIDIKAAQDARERAEAQARQSLERMRAREAQLKELSDAVKDTCPLGSNAAILNRLQSDLHGPEP